jgi:hypothetical protein
MSMSLDNLVKTGQLTAQKPAAAEIQRLLAAAARNLAETSVAGISDETRFDMGYKAIMQCALAALKASGYRHSTSVPGHHQTMLATLPLTIGLTNSDLMVLDALRKKRNVNDYSGDLIDPESVRECIARAETLLGTTRQWLKKNHPELAGPASV